MLFYVTLINSQGEYKIAPEKIVPVWVKSRAFFYLRLCVLNIKATWSVFVSSFGILLIGNLVGVLDPVLLVLLCLLYVFNALLQYSRVYSYTKYIIYLIPLGLFVIERIDLIYVLAAVIAAWNVVLLFRFNLQLYGKPVITWSPIDFGDSKSLWALVAVILFISLLFGIEYYDIRVPIEELLSFVVMVLIVFLQVDLSNNKLLATTVHSRFNLVRSKAPTVSFQFLIPHQRAAIGGALCCALLATSILGVLRNDYLTYFVLFLGILLFFLYTIDYIVYWLLLGQSIIYGNTVVKTYIIDLCFVWSLGMYFVLFGVNKYATQGSNTAQGTNAYHVVFSGYQMGYFVICSMLLAFFSYRLYKTFTINKQLKLKEIEYKVNNGV